MSLNGKHALIMGSSRGIGRGIALKLAASGAKQTAADRQSPERFGELPALRSPGCSAPAPTVRPASRTTSNRQPRRFSAPMPQRDLWQSRDAHKACPRTP